MSYILILMAFTSLSNPPGVTMHKFESQQACMAAGAAAEKLYSGTKWVCTRYS